MAEPQALIFYGDGLQALFYEEGNVRRNRRGEKVMHMLVAPSEEIVKKFRIEEKVLNIITEDGKKAMWVEYPEQLVEWLNRSKTGAVIEIQCAFDGSHTAKMDKLSSLYIYIKELHKQIANLQAGLATISQDYGSVLSNQSELIRKEKELIDLRAEKYNEEDEGS